MKKTKSFSFRFNSVFLISDHRFYRIFIHPQSPLFICCDIECIEKQNDPCYENWGVDSESKGEIFKLVSNYPEVFIFTQISLE